MEPQQRCVQHLRKAFGDRRDVVIVAKALSDSDGYAEMAICETASTISTMSEKWRKEGRFSREYQWTTTERVETTTLDALVAQYGVPAFCKIDVEGFEEKVIRGLSRPLVLMSFEFTKEFFDQAERCMDYLTSIGASSFNCSYGESRELLFHDWVSARQVVDQINRVDDKLLWGDIYVSFLPHENLLRRTSP